MMKKKKKIKINKIILKMKKKSLIPKILKKDIEMKKMIQKIDELVYLSFNKKELLNYFNYILISKNNKLD